LAGKDLTIVVLNSLLITWVQIAPFVPKVQAVLDGPIIPGHLIEINLDSP